MAIRHEALLYSNVRDPFIEQTGTVTRSLYIAAHRMTRQRTTHLVLPNGEAGRATGELPDLLAMEMARDELAKALDMDPIELRVRNDTTTDPDCDAPLTSRSLTECLRTGAQRFGWSDRAKQPRARREGLLRAK